MALPRSSYVNDREIGVYHCFSRCVRRAFLCGFDSVTQRDYSHRKMWVIERLKELAGIFAIEVCAYAVMENHYHTILRTRPDIVATWSDREVVTRWLTLFPHYRCKNDTTEPPTEDRVKALADCTQRVAELRKRLSSLSWFMGRLNEYVARAANREDDVKGKFWESRFKCLNLLDIAAVTACMVYVDLNPIRAGLAATPEQSDFTSIQARILAWRQETMAGAAVPDRDCQNKRDMAKAATKVSEHASHWLCSIKADLEHLGILEMTDIEYFDLVDRSGRILRQDKNGVIDAGLEPILQRIGVKPETWPDMVARFVSKFRVAAGSVASLRRFSEQIGKRWIAGFTAARMAFTTVPQ